MSNPYDPQDYFWSLWDNGTYDCDSAPTASGFATAGCKQGRFYVKRAGTGDTNWAWAHKNGSSQQQRHLKFTSGGSPNNSFDLFPYCDASGNPLTVFPYAGTFLLARFKLAPTTHNIQFYLTGLLNPGLFFGALGVSSTARAFYCQDNALGAGGEGWGQGGGTTAVPPWPQLDLDTTTFRDVIGINVCQVLRAVDYAGTDPRNPLGTPAVLCETWIQAPPIVFGCTCPTDGAKWWCLAAKWVHNANLGASQSSPGTAAINAEIDLGQYTLTDTLVNTTYLYEVRFGIGTFDPAAEGSGIRALPLSSITYASGSLIHYFGPDVAQLPGGRLIYASEQTYGTSYVERCCEVALSGGAVDNVAAAAPVLNDWTFQQPDGAGVAFFKDTGSPGGAIAGNGNYYSGRVLLDPVRAAAGQPSLLVVSTRGFGGEAGSNTAWCEMAARVGTIGGSGTTVTWGAEQSSKTGKTPVKAYTCAGDFAADYPTANNLYAQTSYSCPVLTQGNAAGMWLVPWTIYVYQGASNLACPLVLTWSANAGAAWSSQKWDFTAADADGNTGWGEVSASEISPDSSGNSRVMLFLRTNTYLRTLILTWSPTANGWTSSLGATPANLQAATVQHAGAVSTTAEVVFAGGPICSLPNLVNGRLFLLVDAMNEWEYSDPMDTRGRPALYYCDDAGSTANPGGTWHLDARSPLWQGYNAYQAAFDGAPAIRSDGEGGLLACLFPQNTAWQFLVREPFFFAKETALNLAAPGKVALGTNRGDMVLGTRTDCPAADALAGTSYGDPGAPIIGSGPQFYPSTYDVRLGVNRGDGNSGTCVVPAAADVRHAVAVDHTFGQCYVPPADSVLVGVQVDDNSMGSLGLVQLADLLPIDPNSGAMTLTVGDDYTSNTGQVLPFSDPGNWPNLSANGTTLTLYVRNAAGPQLTVTGSLVANSSPQEIVFQPLHANTATMAASSTLGDNRYAVEADLPGGLVRTLLDDLPCTVRLGRAQ